MNIKKLMSISVILTVALAGCSENNDSAERETLSSIVSQTEYVMQDGDVLIEGEVMQIIGNEVTLALGDVNESSPRKEENGNELSEMPDGENFPQNGKDGKMPQTPNGEDFPKMRENDEMSQMPNGEDFPKMRENENFQMDGRGKKSSVSIEKNGETNSYIIPVGMTVKGANGRNNDYSAVSVGMVLQLTLNSEGYVVAAELL